MTWGTCEKGFRAASDLVWRGKGPLLAPRAGSGSRKQEVSLGASPLLRVEPPPGSWLPTRHPAGEEEDEGHTLPPGPFYFGPVTSKERNKPEALSKR